MYSTKYYIIRYYDLYVYSIVQHGSSINWSIVFGFVFFFYFHYRACCTVWRYRPVMVMLLFTHHSEIIHSMTWRDILIRGMLPWLYHLCCILFYSVELPAAFLLLLYFYFYYRCEPYSTSAMTASTILSCCRTLFYFVVLWRTLHLP